MQPSVAQLRHRYPGVKPFTLEERSLFFGRDKDIEALFSLIFVKQVVVLYGKSGYGKSSLINAGLIPKLQVDSQITYFPIRFNNYSEKEEANAISPTETVQRRLQAEVTTTADQPQPLDPLIPVENSFWYWLKTIQYQHQQANFILFFDQFEELFTYPKEQIDAFSEQLAQLLYPTIPAHFRQRLMELDETGSLPDDLHDFFYQKPDIKMVISVRSDRLSLLNGLTDRHPAILQNCFELQALTPTAARLAVTEPAHSAEACFLSVPFTYEADAIDLILTSVDNPGDGKIETATLQIVCRYIEEELVIRQGITHIGLDCLGDVSDIFRQYYENILDRLPAEGRAKAQQLIEDQLIDNGRRNPLSENYILNKFGIGVGLLRQLEQTSLLRKERDAAGRLLYEVSHDTLVNAIEKVAATRRTQEKEQQRLELERTLQQERDRTDMLLRLNKKAVTRYRLAIGLATLSIGIAVVAFYYWRASDKATLQAQASNREAQKQAYNARIMLYQNNLQKAGELRQKAQQYIDNRAYNYAAEELHNAGILISPTDLTLPLTVRQKRNKLVSEIDSLNRVCQPQLQSTTP